MQLLTLNALKEIINKTKNNELRKRAETELARRLILLTGVK